MITQKQLATKIRVMREGIGMTQDFLAKKVGLGRQAVLAIESGRRSVEGIELSRLAEALKTSMDFLLAEKEGGQGVNLPVAPKVVFQPRKLRNLFLYVLARCGGKPNVGETVLYKLLYFIDFDAFEMTGKSITGLNYKKFQYGPVPSSQQFNKVVNAMVERGELKIIKQTYGNFPQKKYMVFAEPDKDAFSYEELVIINSVIDRLSDMTATKITEYVHEDMPWRLAVTEEMIDYRLAWERTAPFARLDKEKLWQDAAGADTLKVLGAMSKEEMEYYQNL